MSAMCKKAFGGVIAVSRNARAALNKALGSPVDYFETGNTFCANVELQRYLLANKIKHHPCSEFQVAQNRAMHCWIFLSTAPPPLEV
jgi:hypothetical protein